VGNGEVFSGIKWSGLEAELPSPFIDLQYQYSNTTTHVHMWLHCVHNAVFTFTLLYISWQEYLLLFSSEHVCCNILSKMWRDNICFIFGRKISFPTARKWEIDCKICDVLNATIMKIIDSLHVTPCSTLDNYIILVYWTYLRAGWWGEYLNLRGKKWEGGGNNPR